MAVPSDNDEPSRSRRGFLRAAGTASLAGASFGRHVAPSRASGSEPTSVTFGEDANGTIAIEPEGSAGIRSWSSTSDWSAVPQMRLRISRGAPDPNGAEHFMMIPYQYGAAIEYNGVVECWVNEWSIHNHGEGGDVSGAKLWVGNHDDTGGLYMSATRMGDVRYAEIVSQLFSSATGGDLRFVVRRETDGFEFRVGDAGNERVVARMRGSGTLEIRPNGVPALSIEGATGPSLFRITDNGQLYARYERVEQVWLGAAGPGSQAGIAFGRAGDVRLYRAGSRRAVVTGTLIAEDGLGVGDVTFGQPTGPVTHQMPLRDAEGDLIGFVPVHAV